MAREVEDRSVIINKYFDGQAYTLHNTPVAFSDLAIEQAISVVSSNPFLSPSFRALQNMEAYLGIAQKRPIADPFVPKKSLDEEVKAKNNHWLPTVGVELEIPYAVDLTLEKKAPYHVLDHLGIGNSLEQCQWEFILPYSYSWKTQASLLHHLLDLQLIPYEQANWICGPYGRFVAKAGHYSLHYNLGIPIDIERPQSDDFNKDTRYFARTCGLAFSSPERLLSRKTTVDVTTDKESAESDKTEYREYNGRVEIRTLGFGNTNSYRQLLLIQEISSAFFASYRQEVPDNTLAKQSCALRNLWKETRKEMKSLLDDRYHVTDVFNADETLDGSELQKILNTTDIQYQMLRYLRSVAARTRTIIWS